MENNKIKIAVLGAGISGLATAHWLNKDERYDVTVFEKNDEPGGSMVTININDYLIDFGPNSGLETTPLIREIAEDVGLGEEMIYANDVANKRYILRDNKLQELPTGPGAFLKSSLFSLKGKLRLMCEIFIPRSVEGVDESVYDFVKRRLGEEFADYAIDPFVSGVYAGNPHELCVKSAFPKVYDLEQKYGGLIKGMFLGAKERKQRKEKSKNYAKMFSFKNGMQSFPKAIASQLGDRVKYGYTIDKISLADSGYRVHHMKNREIGQDTFDLVVSTIPGYDIPEVMGDLDENLNDNFQKLPYPKVKVLFVVFRKDQIKQPLDGFGFLIPSKEKKRFLGAIWTSTIFTNRAPEDYASFTLFTGGSRNTFDEKFTDEERQRLVLAEFKEVMGIEGPFVYLKEKTWDKAIPQYILGYPEQESSFKYFEEMNKGVLLSGNYRGGISVGDCVKYSKTVKERVDRLIEDKYIPRTNKLSESEI
ncbi:MAG: protoporphyrinogen oxidase [Bacteroidetes bacterium]|nr:protoporphyrinogen oxidase [Bacteroidota bacterium]